MYGLQSKRMEQWNLLTALVWQDLKNRVLMLAVLYGISKLLRELISNEAVLTSLHTGSLIFQVFLRISINV